MDKAPRESLNMIVDALLNVFARSERAAAFDIALEIVNTSSDAAEARRRIEEARAALVDQPLKAKR